MWYEAAVEINETKEFTQFGDRGGLQEITDGLDFRFKWFNTIRGDLVSKELETGGAKNRFRWVNDNAILSKAFKECACMLFVLSGIGTGDEDVIDVRVHKV